MMRFDIFSVAFVLITGGLVEAQIPTIVRNSSNTGSDSRSLFRNFNSSLFNCTLHHYAALFQSIASDFGRLDGQFNVDHTFAVLFNASNIKRICSGLDGLDTCIRQSPRQDGDRIIEQYLDYDKVVPVTRQFFCSDGNDVERRMGCLRQNLIAVGMCSGVFFSVTAQSTAQQRQLEPRTFCPIVDSIINCSALQLRQCDQQVAADYLRQRDLLASSCRTFAETVVTNPTPFDSKIVQCSFSLVERIVGKSNFTAAFGLLSNLTNIWEDRQAEVVRDLCSGINQVIDCIATESATSTYQYDIFAREFLDITNAAQIKQAVLPLCNFARTRLSELSALARCNVSICAQPVIAAYSTLDFRTGSLSGSQLRASLCSPTSQAIRCGSTGLRGCNADIGTLAETFAYDVLRTDCGGRRRNSSDKMAASLSLILVSVAVLFWF